VLLIWGHNLGYKAAADIHSAVDIAADIVDILLDNQDTLEAVPHNRDNLYRRVAVAVQSSCKDCRLLALAVGLPDTAYCRM
jgi:hypothetical protein